MDILFSIIVPAYKYDYLSDCIDSILSQTYKHWQLIIVNDDSPYDIDSIVQKHSDNRIEYYKRHEGFGVKRLVENWNNCLSYCKGDYTLCIGDDDMLTPDCLSEYHRVITCSATRPPIIHGWTAIIDEKNKTYDVMQKHPSYESVYGLIQRQWQGDGYYAGTFLYNTQSLRDAGGFAYFPMAWGSDHITAYTQAALSGVASTNKIVFLYRHHHSTLTTSTEHIKMKLDADLMQKRWFADFLSKDNNSYPEHIIRDILLSNLDKWYYKTMSKDLAECYARKPFCILLYVFKMQNYELSYKILLRAMLLSLIV